MNDMRYKWMLNTIVVVILCTIVIQVYWNYKSYLTNKQQLINDVQVSLDNAVDNYYASIAQHNTLALAFNIEDSTGVHANHEEIDSILENIDIISNNMSEHDSLRIEIIDDVSVYRDSDSIKKKVVKKWQPIKIEMGTGSETRIDSINEESFKLLTSKVIYSMLNDSLRIEKLDSMVNKELQRKNLNIDYGLFFKTPFDSLQTAIQDKTYTLNTSSKSAYLPKGSLLEIRFANSTKLILKRMLLGVFISLILILAVIGCLFYLLKIINHQKQLAEVKNDLISNITHEFKTPIATISVALESIKSFNAIKDKEKTKNYLDMSSDQLEKLNTMVEKLLETATLDSENLELNKETLNITHLIENLVTKYKIQISSKEIHFNNPPQDIIANVDAFHLENAISNIIDNAIKYGGNRIEINISQSAIAFSVSVMDNGNTLDSNKKSKIFEKFYRIPKGNPHDIKGFGIGLYYSKKIVEKHGGLITLDTDKNTTFKMSIPNA